MLVPRPRRSKPVNWWLVAFWLVCFVYLMLVLAIWLLW
jgi:hypothetical protein